MKFKVNKKYVVDAKSHDEAIKIIKKLQDAMNTYEIHWIDTYSKSKGYDKSFWSFKDIVKANDVAEALKKLSGIVVMRGVGTANCLVVNVASNTATYQWSGKLSELLNKSKEQLGDCDKKSINLDDATASGTADLTRIINEALKKASQEKNGLLRLNEKIDVNGKRVKGYLRLFWNGGPMLSFNPQSGDTYMFKGSSAIDIPYDRNSMTVKQSDINRVAGQIFEAADKINATISSLKNEKPKLVGYVLEFIEGRDTPARKAMYNKVVSFNEMVSFLEKEDRIFKESGNRGYDKAYVDAIYSVGNHKYRVHGARFDVGDGNVRSTLSREIGFPEREIDKFIKSGYSTYVKQIDSVKDGLSHGERVKFISELSAELQKLGYPRDKANDIAIKRADALGDDWRARWGGNISAQVRQEIKFTEPYRDSVKDDYKKIVPLTNALHKFKGKNNTYSVVKIKHGEDIKFLVTSENTTIAGYAPAGTIENTESEAIQTAKKYAMSDSIKDEEVSLDYLIKDEIEAINGYKAMIAKTKNPKLLDVLSHILSEEVMHVEELRNAQSGNFEIVDSVKDEYLRTPRGSFELVNESEEMLRHKGWGMWFEHIENGKFYRIMHDPKTQHAVAVFVRNVKDSFYDMAEDEISPEKPVGLKVEARYPNYAIDFTITNDNQNLYRYEKATGKMRKLIGYGPNNFGNAIRGIDRKKIESVAKEVFERNLSFAIIA